jgi:hypothetical protein
LTSNPEIFHNCRIMKHIAPLVSAACLAAVVLISPEASAFGKKKASSSPSPAASASPAAKATASPSASPGVKTVRVIPFHGMISAVDTKAKTFTIAGKDKSRVFKISDSTVVTKTGAAATIKDVKEKEEVRGSYWKEADGSLQAKTVKLGPLTEQEKAAEAARKAKRAEKKAAKAAAAASASPATSEAPAASPKASP